MSQQQQQQSRKPAPSRGTPTKQPPGLASKSQPVRAYMDSMLMEVRQRHRMGFLNVVQSMMGGEVLVETEGQAFRGQLYTMTPLSNSDFKVVLRQSQGEQGAALDGPTVIFDNNFRCVVSKDSGIIKAIANQDFNTDAGISGARFQGHGRKLKTVDETWLSTSEGGLSSKAGGGAPEKWDQFAVNERMESYKKSAFDENLYTKRLDLGDLSKEQIDKATKLARDIEAQQSSNIHEMEERNQTALRDVDDLNEETRYSGCGTEIVMPPTASASASASSSAAGSWRKGAAARAGPAGQGQSPTKPASPQGKYKGPAAGAAKSPVAQAEPAAAAAAAAPPSNSSAVPAAAATAAAAPAAPAAPAAAPTPAATPAVTAPEVPSAAAKAAEPSPAKAEPAAAAAPVAAPAAAAAAPSAENSSASAESKSKLNVNAKEFKPRAMTAQAPMQVPMARPPVMYMDPMMMGAPVFYGGQYQGMPMNAGVPHGFGGYEGMQPPMFVPQPFPPHPGQQFQPQYPPAPGFVPHGGNFNNNNNFQKR